LKELGAYLKEQRIATGVGAEEAASDLEITLDDIENIESGNIRAFKDVLLLKEYIRDYAKYLGLSPEKIVDEFNDVLFEKTSKISLDDILETKKEIEEKEKVYSPYTKPKKKKVNVETMVKLKPLFKALLIVLLLLLISYIYVMIIKDDKNDKRSVELDGMRSDIYEFTQ